MIIRNEYLFLAKIRKLAFLLCAARISEITKIVLPLLSSVTYYFTIPYKKKETSRRSHIYKGKRCLRYLKNRVRQRLLIMALFVSFSRPGILSSRRQKALLGSVYKPRLTFSVHLLGARAESSHHGSFSPLSERILLLQDRRQNLRTSGIETLSHLYYSSSQFSSNLPSFSLTRYFLISLSSLSWL